jgi:hypothetical protein
MVHTIKQSKPWDEQTLEERAADMNRFIDELKALDEFMEKQKAEQKAEQKAPPREAEIVEFRADRVLSEVELIARQAALDAAWERKLQADRERGAEEAGRYGQFAHRGPQDPDWPGRRY